MISKDPHDTRKSQIEDQMNSDAADRAQIATFGKVAYETELEPKRLDMTLLAKTVPVVREAVDSIDALRNAYANSPISPAWVRVTDARNALSDFLATVKAGGKP